MKLRELVSFDFFKEADQWLSSIKMLKAQQTYRNYKVAIDSARAYETSSGNIWDIELIDAEFVDSYIKYLILDSLLLETTVDKYLRTIRLFVSETYPEFDASIINISKLREKLVWLYSGELLTLKALDVSSPWDKIRDIFLFQCTTGLRFHDIQRWDHEWLEHTDLNIVEYPQLYPGKAAYTVLKGVAEEILKAYGGKTPKMEVKEYGNGLRALLHTLDFRRPVKVWERIDGKMVYWEKPLALAVGADTGRQTYIMQLLISNVPLSTAMTYAGHFDFNTFRPYVDPARRYTKKFLKSLYF